MFNNRYNLTTPGRSPRTHLDHQSSSQHIDPHLSNRVIVHFESQPTMQQPPNIMMFGHQSTPIAVQPAPRSHPPALPRMNNQRKCSICACQKNVSTSNGPPFCSNCKKFIQKINSRHSNIPTECITGQNNCIINDNSRNNCRYCRLKRYIEITSQPLIVPSSQPRKKITKSKKLNSANSYVNEAFRTRCSICGSHLRVENRLNVLCCQACYKFAHVIGEGKAKCPTECISGRNSCIIDLKSRGHCRFCRLQKCLIVGMNLNLPSQSIPSTQMKQTTSTSTKQTSGCPVCGSEQNMTIYNYNSACNNCKKFINKIKIGRSTVPIKCISGQMNCIIDEKLKSYCRFCRLQKCLGLGMSIQLPARGKIPAPSAACAPAASAQINRKPKTISNGKICSICGSVHRVENCFKVPCCQACQKFLYKIKTDRRSMPPKCSTGTNDCIINEITRTNCRYCRMQKFLHISANANPGGNPLANEIMMQPQSMGTGHN